MEHFIFVNDNPTFAHFPFHLQGRQVKKVSIDERGNELFSYRLILCQILFYIKLTMKRAVYYQDAIFNLSGNNQNIY